MNMGFLWFFIYLWDLHDLHGGFLKRGYPQIIQLGTHCPTQEGATKELWAPCSLQVLLAAKLAKDA